MKKRFSGDDWRLNKISRYLGQVYLSLSLDWSHNSYCLSHEISWEILWAMFMVSWWMEDLLESKTSSWITADKKRRFMIWLILAGVYPIQPEISLKVLFGCAFNTPSTWCASTKYWRKIGSSWSLLRSHLICICFVRFKLTLNSALILCPLGIIQHEGRIFPSRSNSFQLTRSQHCNLLSSLLCTHVFNKWYWQPNALNNYKVLSASVKPFKHYILWNNSGFRQKYFLNIKPNYLFAHVEKQRKK